MPGANVAEAHGITLTFGTSGFVFYMRRIGASMERGEIDANHFGITAPSTNETLNGEYLAAAIASGEFTAGGFFNTEQEDATHQPPINRPAETITLAWPQASGDSDASDWQFTGFVKGYNVTGELGNAIECDLTIRITGKVTIDPAN